MKINYWHKFEETQSYHIYNRAINKEKLFLKDENYYYFLQKWKKYISPFSKTFAYCLIPNHFHFIIQIKGIDENILELIKSDDTKYAKDLLQGKINYNSFLEQQFKRLFSSYALAFNKQNDRRGSLFEKRFKRIEIKTEHHLLYLINYVHHNPIHHRISDKYEDWKFSSYKSYCSEKETLISKNEILEKFGNDKNEAITNFKNFHKDNQQIEINEAYFFDEQQLFGKPKGFAEHMISNEATFSKSYRFVK